MDCNSGLGWIITNLSARLTKVNLHERVNAPLYGLVQAKHLTLAIGFVLVLVYPIIG